MLDVATLCASYGPFLLTKYEYNNSKGGVRGTKDEKARMDDSSCTIPAQMYGVFLCSLKPQRRQATRASAGASKRPKQNQSVEEGESEGHGIE